MTDTAAGPADYLPAVYQRPSWIRTAYEHASPAILPTAILLTARWWHAEGAAHSIGDAIIPAAGAIVSLGTGLVCALTGQHLTKGAAIGLTLTGTFAAAGVVAYTGGLALPALLWTISTAVAVKLAGVARAAETRARNRAAEEAAARREQDTEFERREAAAHTRRMEREEQRQRAEVTVTALKVLAQVTTAELEANTAVTVAELAAGHGHAMLPGVERNALPDRSGRPELVAMLAADTAATYQVEQVLDAPTTLEGSPC